MKDNLSLEVTDLLPIIWQITFQIFHLCYMPFYPLTIFQVIIATPAFHGDGTKARRQLYPSHIYRVAVNGINPHEI